MARKYILIDGEFVNVSDDVIPVLNQRLLPYEGTMLFGEPTGDRMQASGGHQNYHLGLVSSDAELTTQRADTTARTYPIIDTRTLTAYVWDGSAWQNVGSGLNTIKAFVFAQRFYYNPLTKVMWYASSELTLTQFLKRDNPFATQANATAGSGDGLLSPLKLKNAYGSW